MCRHKPDSTVPAHPGEAVSAPARLPAQRARLLFTLPLVAPSDSVRCVGLSWTLRQLMWRGSLMNKGDLAHSA